MSNDKDQNGLLEGLGFVGFLVAGFFSFKLVAFLQKNTFTKDAITISLNWNFYLWVGGSIVILWAILGQQLVLKIRGKANDFNISGLSIAIVLVSLFFGSFYDYTSMTGIYSNALFSKKIIRWEQVDGIEIDAYRPSKGLTRLVYKIKAENGREVEIGGFHKITYGSLNQLDQLLTRKNIAFDVEKLEKNRLLKSLMRQKVKSEDKIIVRRHLRNL